MVITQKIIKLLQGEKVCTLATCKDNEPYLSLMNFTFDEESQRIILSSRRNSKKFENILSNREVSLLIHNDNPGTPLEDIVSVTINGKAYEEDAQRDYYQKLHTTKHNNRHQFIIGDEIAILLVSIDKIHTSDIHDQVTTI
ncbi:pyridoxamine 5'-phosphate oxidase family protein [Tissierella creatinini]|nr:pyridoxamine 5'-phosphate oxidase family protein [Tissierella creatinini]TJX60116.1 pyridoxamine 5'-phosphate oxidase family protein [Soehngenia saccharolytica]